LLLLSCPWHLRGPEPLRALKVKSCHLLLLLLPALQQVHPAAVQPGELEVVTVSSLLEQAASTSAVTIIIDSPSTHFGRIPLNMVASF